VTMRNPPISMSAVGPPIRVTFGKAIGRASRN
jgi:hypothetical protein